MAPTTSRIPVPAARKKLEVATELKMKPQSAVSNLNKIDSKSRQISKPSAVRQPLKQLKQQLNQPVMMSTINSQRTSEKPVEVRPMQPPNTNVVVGQKKKRFEAPKSVRFEAQISEVSGKSTGPVKDRVDFELDPAALQSILNNRGVASFSSGAKLSNANGHSGSIYNVPEPRASIYTKSASKMKSNAENPESFFVTTCFKLSKDDSAKVVVDTGKTPIRPQRPASIYEVRGRTPGSANKKVQPSVVKQSAQTFRTFNSTTVELTNSSAEAYQSTLKSSAMRGRSHPVFPSPLVTVKEESIIISGGSGSLSADVSQTDSIISLSQPKEMGTSSVEWPKSSKLCSQLAALTIRTPDIESEYSQLTPRRLNNRKMELLKRLDILDKCIRQKTTSDNANQESVKQVEEEETVIGRLSFDESGSDETENILKLLQPTTGNAMTTSIPSVSVENVDEKAGWRDKIATPKPKRSHQTAELAENNGEKPMAVGNEILDLSTCDEELIDFEPPMKTPLVLRSVSKINRGVKLTSMSKNSSPLGAASARRNTLPDVSPSENVKKTVAGSVREFLSSATVMESRVKSPLFETPITALINHQSPSLSCDINNETVFMPDSLLSGDETFLRDELEAEVSSIALSTTVETIYDLSPIAKPPKKINRTTTQVPVAVLVDFGDDPVCDHEVDQYLKPMESGGISPFQFERISNPIAKNFTGGDDFMFVPVAED